MAVVRNAALTETAAFGLGTVGTLVAQRFADLIAPLDLKPKHVGLLTLLASGGATSQLDLARALGVAPSLVVRLADHLEALAAIDRVRDPGDRRRQTLSLTEHGRRLLATCAEITADLEADMLAGMPATERKALRAALSRVAANLSGRPSR
ncbi:MarR family winged helix-turn-helix transcriptional regulator [Kutzneria sp. CA-103260]|uniref:MarR family winged helix-turn-helix transcriptional regulator n=1 Tax=Kutzneria sp. CA-103260 TaxID=2802641 RepID=UPI001BA45A19|nr:MarR family winged helix-turn-helix transcriptional regulator [Kutzneria sp. CA-103260]QUQ64803.1 MarR family transcriptional regulator [Kutzneria sp. CA-103260]